MYEDSFSNFSNCFKTNKHCDESIQINRLEMMRKRRKLKKVVGGQQNLRCCCRKAADKLASVTNERALAEAAIVPGIGGRRKQWDVPEPSVLARRVQRIVKNDDFCKLLLLVTSRSVGQNDARPPPELIYSTIHCQTYLL